MTISIGDMFKYNSPYAHKTDDGIVIVITQINDDGPSYTGSIVYRPATAISNICSLVEVTNNAIARHIWTRVVLYDMYDELEAILNAE